MAVLARITVKSMEERGASAPNIVELAFSSESDANIFGSNLDSICSGINVSNDIVLSSNYALPYPDGTNGMTRTALTDGAGAWQQMRVYDKKTPFDVDARAAALIASGFLMDPSGIAPTSATITSFTPGPSV